MPAGAVAGLLAEVAVDLELRRGVEAQRRRRVAVAAQALAGVVVLGRALDQSDAAVAEAGEVADHGEGAAVIVDVDRVEGGAVHQAVEQQDRQRLGQVGLERMGVDVGRHDDQAVDAAAHGAQQGLDLGAVVMGAGDQQVIAAAVRGRVDAAHHLGEELAVEIREQHADGVGLVGDQAAGGAVGRVAQPLGDLEDAAARLAPDRPLVVEHPRDGRDRDLRLPRDLLDRGAHPRAPPCCRETGTSARPTHYRLRQSSLDCRCNRLHSRYRTDPVAELSSGRHPLEPRGSQGPVAGAGAGPGSRPAILQRFGMAVTDALGLH